MTEEDRPKTMAEARARMAARPRDSEDDKRRALSVAAWAVRDFPDDPQALKFAAYANDHADVSEIVDATGLDEGVVEREIAAFRARQVRYEQRWREGPDASDRHRLIDADPHTRG